MIRCEREVILRLLSGSWVALASLERRSFEQEEGWQQKISSLPFSREAVQTRAMQQGEGVDGQERRVQRVKRTMMMMMMMMMMMGEVETGADNRRHYRE